MPARSRWGGMQKRAAELAARMMSRQFGMTLVGGTLMRRSPSECMAVVSPTLMYWATGGRSKGRAVGRREVPASGQLRFAGMVSMTVRALATARAMS